MAELPPLLAAVRACTVCAPWLPCGPRPIVQAGTRARLLIIGQAPGTAVHASGVPWDDPSGDRLRDWTGIDRAVFYDPERVAQMPMGFCYPGRSASGADAPPRPECAPLWHARLLAALPMRQLTLLVGHHAQARYCADRRTMTARVAAAAEYLPAYFPLPHPSWRATGWMRRNPWFEAGTLPRLRACVAAVLAEPAQGDVVTPP